MWWAVGLLALLRSVSTTTPEMPGLAKFFRNIVAPSFPDISRYFPILPILPILPQNVRSSQFGQQISRLRLPAAGEASGGGRRRRMPDIFRAFRYFPSFPDIVRAFPILSGDCEKFGQSRTFHTRTSPRPATFPCSTPSSK